MKNTDWRNQAAVDCESLLREGRITYERRYEAAPYLLNLHENELRDEARKGLQAWIGEGREVEKQMWKLVREFLEQWTPAKWKQKEVTVD